MNKSKKNTSLPLVLITILLISFHLTFITAKAEESLEIIDGVYQVELSFQSLTTEEDELFSRKATLTVKNERYKLSLPIQDASTTKLVSIEQAGKHIPFVINKDENLVEVDLLALQQVVQLEGTIDVQDNQSNTFKRQFTIETNSLPKVEKPEPEQKPEVKPDSNPGSKPDQQPKPQPGQPPVEKPDKEQSKPEKPKVEKPQEIKLEYQLLVNGKKDLSIMNTYVDPIAKVIQVDGHYVIEMKLIKSAWITELKVDKNGEMIEPKTISLKDNVRTIQFTMDNLEKEKLMWVKVDIAALNYHHDYKVQLVFNQDQVAQLIGQTGTPEKPSASEEGRTQEQAVPITQKTEKTPVKEAEKQPAAIPKRGNESSMAPASSALPQTSAKMSNPEELLAFDRSLDELTDEVVIEDERTSEEISSPTKHQPINTDIQLSTADKIKISLLVIILIISGYLLVRRIKRTKKDSVSE